MEMSNKPLQAASSTMIFLAFLVGILAALTAMLFRFGLAIVHNIFFLGKFDFNYTNTSHTPPSPWGLGIVLVPPLGAIVVTWLIENFAAEERGLSVPEIMYRVRNKLDKINPRVSLAKGLAAIISLGTGASLGREGPVMQLGASLATVLENYFNLTPQQRAVIAVAGAAGATAATFHAPLSGLFFALELLLISITAYHVVLVMIAVSTAILIEYSLMGAQAFFRLPAVSLTWAPQASMTYLAIFILFGTLMGLFSTVFIRGVYWTEDRLTLFFKNPYLRHLLGMSLVGVMIYLSLYFLGHYDLEGIGFATIQDALSMLIKNPWLFLLLFVGKLLASCITLGSGASGGVFSPALFLGATFGSACGLVLNVIFPDLGLSPVIFVVVGMAGMLGSITGASLTAFTLCFEMTQDYALILPMLIVVVSAFITRKAFCTDSIYTLKLARQGLV